MARFLILAALLACPLAAQDLVIRGARIIDGKQAGSRRGNVLVRDGRIAKVGRIGKVDPAVPVIQATGRWVMPGFVLAHTSSGLERPNERMSLAPFVSVLDSLNPVSVFLEDSLRDGHLTMLVMPGNSTVVGGMGAVLHPFGRSVGQMTVVKEAGLKISLIPPSGNRAAHMAQLRGALDRARDQLERLKLEGKLEKEKKLSGNWKLDLESMQVARRERAMIRLLKKELRAYIACGTAGDVLQALGLIKEYGIEGQLVCGPGTWRAAKLLGQRKVPVILSSIFEVEEKDPATGKTVRRIIPRIFHDAGVRFAVTSRSDPQGNLGSRYLWYQAATLVRYGIPKDVALRSVTSTAADLIGLGDRKGSVETGKDADLLILTDEPFSGRAWVDVGIIEGRVAYNRKNDRRLSEVFGARTR